MLIFKAIFPFRMKPYRRLWRCLILCYEVFGLELEITKHPNKWRHFYHSKMKRSSGRIFKPSWKKKKTLLFDFKEQFEKLISTNIVCRYICGTSLTTWLWNLLGQKKHFCLILKNNWKNLFLQVLQVCLLDIIDNKIVKGAFVMNVCRKYVWYPYPNCWLFNPIK